MALENSLRDQLVVVLGGSGYVGRHLAQELLSRGCRLRIASRTPERAQALKPLAGLGQLQLVRCNILDDSSLAAALVGADAVVNLVGAFSGNLDDVQGKGAGRLAIAAANAGARALVHVSAIGANADSPIDYARTKAEGEEAILAAFSRATIVRSSLVLAADSELLNRLAGLIAMFPALPVFAPEAQLQPVLAADLAAGIASAVADSGRHGGKTFELAGPEVLTMLELNQRLAAGQGRDTTFIPLPDSVSRLFSSLTGWLPGAPISRDQFELLRAGNVASGKLPGLKELGVSARPLGLFLDRWMERYRVHGRFSKVRST